MSVFTNWQQQAGLTLSKPSSFKKGDFACQWLENVGLVGFVALRPKSTAMVIAGRSVHLTTLFPGQA